MNRGNARLSDERPLPPSLCLLPRVSLSNDPAAAAGGATDLKLHQWAPAGKLGNSRVLSGDWVRVDAMTGSEVGAPLTEGPGAPKGVARSSTQKDRDITADPRDPDHVGVWGGGYCRARPLFQSLPRERPPYRVRDHGPAFPGLRQARSSLILDRRQGALVSFATMGLVGSLEDGFSVPQGGRGECPGGPAGGAGSRGRDLEVARTSQPNRLRGARFAAVGGMRSVPPAWDLCIASLKARVWRLGHVED